MSIDSSVPLPSGIGPVFSSDFSRGLRNPWSEARLVRKGPGLGDRGKQATSTEIDLRTMTCAAVPHHKTTDPAKALSITSDPLAYAADAPISCCIPMEYVSVSAASIRLPVAAMS
jgi:hypothetical protein